MLPNLVLAPPMAQDDRDVDKLLAVIIILSHGWRKILWASPQEKSWDFRPSYTDLQYYNYIFSVGSHCWGILSPFDPYIAFMPVQFLMCNLTGSLKIVYYTRS